MILFLTPTELEQRYIKDEPWLVKKIIGVGDNCLKHADQINREQYKVVVLFGMCGLLHDNMTFTELYCLGSIAEIPLTEYKNHGFYAKTAKCITTPNPIHTAVGKETYEFFDTVDQESWFVASTCINPLIILRYGIDYCDKKLVRFPFNWIMRKIQHYAAQREMNKILNQIYFGEN